MNNVKDKPILQSIHIANFKCFERLSIDTLARVNLIAGKNSVGKTAALEALFLLIGSENLELILKISQFRGIRELKGDLRSILELLWSPLFYSLDIKRKIKIGAVLNDGKTYDLEFALVPEASKDISLNGDNESNVGLKSGLSTRQILQLRFIGSQTRSIEYQMKFVDGNLRIEPSPPDPPFPGYFQHARRSPSQEESATMFGQLIRSKQIEEVNLVDILKIIEPRLTELDVIPSAGTSMIYGDIGLDQMLPISLMGDGMARVMDIVLRIANASGGVVLIDEIENGLHYSVIQDFWRVVGAAAKTFNTQIIATTHSYECIREAYSAFHEGDSNEFLLHRLDRIHDHVEVVAYDQEALAAAIQSDFEVR